MEWDGAGSTGQPRARRCGDRNAYGYGNAAKNPQKVALAGVGTGITISPVAVNFGEETVGSTRSVAQITLTNLGTSAVLLGAIGQTGANSGDFKTANNCGKSVAMNGKLHCRSCMIKVAFKKPTATGARSTSVSMTDNGGGSPQTIALTGTGT
jgi:hypothetical protein